MLSQYISTIWSQVCVSVGVVCVSVIYECLSLLAVSHFVVVLPELMYGAFQLITAYEQLDEMAKSIYSLCVRTPSVSSHCNDNLASKCFVKPATYLHGIRALSWFLKHGIGFFVPLQPHQQVV